MIESFSGATQVSARLKNADADDGRGTFKNFADALGISTIRLRKFLEKFQALSLESVASWQEHLHLPGGVLTEEDVSSLLPIDSHPSVWNSLRQPALNYLDGEPSRVGNDESNVEAHGGGQSGSGRLPETPQKNAQAR